MKKKIYFNIGSHKNIQGIKSYFDIFNDLLPNYEIILTKSLQPKSINILVENFNSKEAKKIEIFKKEKNALIILVVTEFYNKKLDIFNCFDLNQIRYIKFLKNFFYFYYRFLVFRFYIKDIIKKFLIKNFNFNILKYRKFKKNFVSFFNKDFNQSTFSRAEKFYRYFYFKNRYENYTKIVDLADIIMTSHPQIYQQHKNKYEKVYYAMPYLNKFKPNMNLKLSNTFKFSGEFNSYRSIFFKNLQKKIEKIHIKDNDPLLGLVTLLQNFSKIQKNDFIDISKENKFSYSLHPKRNNFWNFSSPIRYIDAVKNGEIPLVFDKFDDFFSKNLSIYIDLNSPKLIKELFGDHFKNNVKRINKGIEEYNKFLKENNNNFTKDINNIIKKLDEK